MVPVGVGEYYEGYVSGLSLDGPEVGEHLGTPSGGPRVDQSHALFVHLDQIRIGEAHVWDLMDSVELLANSSFHQSLLTGSTEIPCDAFPPSRQSSDHNPKTGKRGCPAFSPSSPTGRDDPS